jgi:hypothetical protein
VLAFGDSVTATLQNGTFMNSQASSMIRAMGASCVTVQDTVFQGNTGRYGSGLTALGNTTLSIEGCMFLDNNATLAGGCVDAFGNSSVSININHTVQSLADLEVGVAWRWKKKLTCPLLGACSCATLLELVVVLQALIVQGHVSLAQRSLIVQQLKLAVL